MGFNSGFKGLKICYLSSWVPQQKSVRDIVLKFPSPSVSTARRNIIILGIFTARKRRRNYSSWFNLIKTSIFKYVLQILILTRGRPGRWETDLVYFIINGNINFIRDVFFSFVLTRLPFAEKKCFRLKFFFPLYRVQKNIIVIKKISAKRFEPATSWSLSFYSSAAPLTLRHYTPLGMIPLVCGGDRRFQ